MAMNKLSISKAAEMFGVARSTVQRRISSGELSYATAGQGSHPNAKVIDLSDLIRVFGEPSLQSDTVLNATKSDSILQLQNEALQRENILLRERVSDLKTMLDQKEKVIENQRNQIAIFFRGLTNKKRSG